MRTEPTEAFKKYIDPVFICQNHLWFYAPRRFDKNLKHNEMSLETYADEQQVISGMCVYLAEEIEELLSFDEALNTHKKEMFDVASDWDLDAVETDKKIKNLESRIFAHAKLQYCFDNYIKNKSINNDIEILACLMAMFAKIMKVRKEKHPYKNIKDVYRTNFYKYVKEAYFEQCGRDIKKYSQFTFQDFGNKIFDLVVDDCYDIEHVVNEPMLSADGDSFVIRVYSIEELNDIEDLKKEMEAEVFDWMINKIRVNDHLICN